MLWLWLGLASVLRVWTMVGDRVSVSFKVRIGLKLG